jgi:hypothetical protein
MGLLAYSLILRDILYTIPHGQSSFVVALINMKTNKKSVSTFKTAPAAKRVAGGSGAVADTITAEQTLRRCVLTNLLWEDCAYESGVEIAQKIRETIPQVPADRVAAIAIEARGQQKLRHVPLLLVREMARLDTHRHVVADTLPQIIQRADELAEFCAIWQKDDKKPLSKTLSAQAKKGLARAFVKFDEYALAKYNRDNAVKLRDVLFLCHAKPENKAQEKLFKRLINDELKTPDTWEVELSASTDKKASWTRLLEEAKLGALAFIRNLRNLTQAGVEKNLIRDYFKTVNPERVLPFNFLSAVREAPEYTAQLETLMLKCLATFPKLKGKTVFIVDVSGSMTSGLAGKSSMNRLDAAAALTALMREVCEEPVIYATAGCDGSRKHETKEVPAARGFALMEEIRKMQHSLGGGGIFLCQSTKFVKELEKTADRLIVLNDSQDCDYVKDPNQAAAFGRFNYLMDVSCHTKGVAYKAFTHIDGWSESVINFVYETERMALQSRQKK